jgi:hypothetical protein
MNRSIALDFHPPWRKPKLMVLRRPMIFRSGVIPNRNTGPPSAYRPTVHGVKEFFLKSQNLCGGSLSRSNWVRGVARAARIPVLGRVRVASFIAAFASHFWTDANLTWIEANGQASVLISRDDVVFALATIDASSEGIHQHPLL